MEVTLGWKVRDRITGFEGIAIARTVYLQGCARILIQPPVNKEGVVPEASSFDEPDLSKTGNGIVPEPKPKKEKEPPGGPRPHATQRADIEKRA